MTTGGAFFVCTNAVRTTRYNVLNVGYRQRFIAGWATYYDFYYILALLFSFFYACG